MCVVLERREWLSFEKHRHRIATFGTMSSISSSTSATEPTSSVGGGDGLGLGLDNGSGDAVLDVTDADNVWKAALGAGDLIDARDGTGMWYQVSHLTIICIMLNIILFVMMILVCI